MRSPLRPLLLCLLAAGCSASGGHAAAPPSAPRAAADRPLPPLVAVHATEPREQTADQQVQQVLNRLAFGPRPGDAALVRRMGVDEWIARQLAPERLDDPAMDAVLVSYEKLRRPTRDIVRAYAEGREGLRLARRRAVSAGDSAGGRDSRADALRDDAALRRLVRENRRVVGEVQSARLARAVASERQLQEVMTDFWENHFSVYAGKGVTRLFIPAYDRDVVRPLALGRFRDLLGAVAKSPAMLFYLDQWQSTADTLHPTLAAMPAGVAAARRRAAGRAPRPPAPRPPARRGLNENYARELLELHTLGVDAGYTQNDVIEVARALTGWTMAPRADGAFLFRPGIHDAGEKTVLGHRLPAGRGIEDGEAVLDILARDPRTARFIARKLAVRFVSDAPPAALVDRAAAVFIRTDGDLREVVRAVVTSQEFFSRSAYRTKVKSPFELVASALRAVGAAPDTSMRSAQVVAFLGQPIFGHQAPNGWPETGEAWMNTGAILNRINFGLALAAGRLPGVDVTQWAESMRLGVATREQQVDAVVSAFLGGHASPDTRQTLLSGENPLAARLPADSVGGAMAAMTGEPASGAGADARPGRNGPPRAARQHAIGRPVRLDGLARVVGLAIGAPEFQRR